MRDGKTYHGKHTNYNEVVRCANAPAYLNMQTLFKHVRSICRELNICGATIALDNTGGNCFRPDNTVHLDLSRAVETDEYGLRWFNDVRFFQSLAHELRHVWQYRQGLLDILAYRESGEDYAAYMRQPVEVDARRYARAYVERAFGHKVVQDCLGAFLDVGGKERHV